MRPVRLEAEGFTCYRERQEPLDFSGLSLFAIAGPTGAGKSSILDTMLYALYGEVPRIGKQGIGEFIAHGRDAMSVSLDFAVRGAVYRVVRRVKRGKKNLTTQATLAELTSGGERSLADAVKPVNEGVEKLLGLDFDAFTQTVILPQGEFAKFLKADPKDQRGILQHLLRHDVFTRMREEAERRRLGFDRDLKGIEGQLEAYAHATAESLEARQAERDVAANTVARLRTDKDRLESALKDIRARRDLTMQVHQLRERRTALDERAPTVQAMRDELSAARRAAPVMPRIEAVTQADVRLARARTESAEAAHRAGTARAALTQAEQKCAAVEKAAAACPALKQRITAIDEIKGDLARRATLVPIIVKLTTNIADARRTAEDAEAKSATAANSLRSEAEALAAARRELASIEYDADELQRFEGLWPSVARVRAIDHELVGLNAACVDCEADLRGAEVRGAESDRQFEQAERAHDTAVADEASAVRALDAARVQNQAAALRLHLHEGEPCPVCLQEVSTLPRVDAVPELTALDEARTAASASVSATQRALRSAGEQRAGARARIEAARKAVSVALSAVEQKKTARAALMNTLVGALAPTGSGPGDEEACALVENRRTQLQAARAEHEAAAARLRTAESRQSAATIFATKAEAEHDAAVQRLQHLEADERNQREELAATVERIQSVSTHQDPSAERADLASQLARLEQAVHRARQECSAAQVASASAEERERAAAATVVQAEQSARSAADALSGARAEGAFASAEAATAAVIDASGQAARERQVSQYDADRAGVLAGLADTEPKIAGREVSAEQLASAERACTAAFDAWHEAEKKHDALVADCERLAGQVETHARLTAQREALQRALDLHAGMATDLQGNGFQEYLLEEAFHALVTGASVRMRQMSNRYTLEWEEGDFFVVDHDNAGERRRAETLSGGETFMASLCLALQLSDEVLKTSGALQMDSLFIDEGFGTLDADALSEVTDAMEALRHDGSRLIGVISHRPELTDRLPGCIRVVKGAGESRWVLERIG